jgi:hypothetical protein
MRGSRDTMSKRLFSACCGGEGGGEEQEVAVEGAGEVSRGSMGARVRRTAENGMRRG